MNDNFNKNQPNKELGSYSTNSRYSFYFRCVACNKPINQHSRLTHEDGYCDRCSSLAYDYTSDREYQHLGLTDEILACYYATTNED